MLTPQDYSLPHDEWRAGQGETVAALLQLPHGTNAVVEAPTGSGKTSFAAASASRQRTMSLVKTKSLQQENYADAYGFDILQGRGNYLCAHPLGKYLGATAAECLSADNMFACEYRDSCLYLQAKHRAKGSYRAALNYALYLMSRWPKEEDTAPRALYLDECHLLPEIVLDFVGTTVNDKTRRRWMLARFPQIETRRGNLLVGSTTPPTEPARSWLNDSVTRLAAQHNDLQARFAKLEDRKTLDALRTCERLHKKLLATAQALTHNQDDWYIHSGRGAHPNGGPGFVCRPLTSKYDAARLFSFNSERWTSVLMSATIGDASVLAAELGIEDFTHLNVPNQFAPKTRPVRVLDAPKIGHKSEPAAYEKQADVIADAINSAPIVWSGIIHTSSWVQARALTERLAHRGLQDRVWVYDRNKRAGGTDKQAQAWRNRRQQVPNSLLISPTTHEGYDGIDERICIVAKTPFPYLGDPYEKARMSHSGKFFLQRTAWDLAQALGRTRRGNHGDYDIDATNGLVAIADGNWVRCQKYLPADVREAIVKD